MYQTVRFGSEIISVNIQFYLKYFSFVRKGEISILDLTIHLLFPTFWNFFIGYKKAISSLVLLK